MKQLATACKSILDQLKAVVEQVREEDFSKPSVSLSNATIGQHLRHTVEFFICLEEGFEKGLVNYDRRNHDQLMESDKYIAAASLRGIGNFISTRREDKPLKLEVAYERDCEHWVT